MFGDVGWCSWTPPGKYHCANSVAVGAAPTLTDGWWFGVRIGGMDCSYFGDWVFAGWVFVTVLIHVVGYLSKYRFQNTYHAWNQLGPPRGKGLFLKRSSKAWLFY